MFAKVAATAHVRLIAVTPRDHHPTRLTKTRSPTTTGKIEHWHKTLRRELRDAAGPFPDVESAQASIDAWVNGYNHSRPHQSLAMATRQRCFGRLPSNLSQRFRRWRTRWRSA